MIATVDFPKMSHVKKRAFLAAFSRCGSLSAAAKRARVDRRSHYNWLADPVYKQAFQQAVREAGDALEDKLNELAHDGNVTAAIFLLKGLRPEKYKDRQESTFKWSGNPDDLSPELQEAYMSHLKKIAFGDDTAAAEAFERKVLLEAGGQVVDIEPAGADEAVQRRADGEMSDHPLAGKAGANAASSCLTAVDSMS